MVLIRIHPFMFLPKRKRGRSYTISRLLRERVTSRITLFLSPSLNSFFLLHFIFNIWHLKAISFHNRPHSPRKYKAWQAFQDFIFTTRKMINLHLYPYNKCLWSFCHVNLYLVFHKINSFGLAFVFYLQTYRVLKRVVLLVPQLFTAFLYCKC